MTTFKGLTTPSFGFPSLKAIFRSGSSTPIVKTEIKSSLQDEVRKELYEIEDQRQRALNSIVFNAE
jgi:hypothetical protein